MQKQIVTTLGDIVAIAATCFLFGCLIGFAACLYIVKDRIKPAKVQCTGYTVISADSILTCDGIKKKRVWQNK
jgi:hypothetical protein